MEGNAERLKYIRQAKKEDASRLAEILVFTKRTNYRSVFHNDRVSFGEMQVLPLGMELLANKALLDSYWVYDDEFVKGLIRIEKTQIVELYVDPFFEGQGIGRALLEFAVHQKNADFLWVLEQNKRAIAFYVRNGFQPSEERVLEYGVYNRKLIR